jgi:FMN phosphatase YigB (HAD superfamily)
MFERKLQSTPTIPYQLVSQVNPRTKLVITDVDGTLASFWDYFVPAIRDFLREISVKLDTPVISLAEDIGRIVDRRGTHEYPWLLEETSFAWEYFADCPQDFIKDFVRPFWGALDSNRAKYLRPYPQVLETLTELKRKGIAVVALSDAPEYMARARNKQMFDGLLDAVYALETQEPDTKDIFQPITLAHGRRRVNAIRKATTDIKSKVVVLPKHYEKPSPHGLDQVLKDFGVLPHEAIFVGDSLTKDGLVAASRGIRFVWAHYGHHLPAEYEEIIHYSLKPEGAESTPPSAVPLVLAIAARYDELLNHV